MGFSSQHLHLHHLKIPAAAEIRVSAMEAPSSRLPRRHGLLPHAPSPLDDLSLSGCHALLFDDDAMASFIHSHDALLPWNGDPSLVIDRYDVRHLLQDLSGIRKRRSPPPLLDVTEEELNFERYRDLDDHGEEDDLSTEEVSKSATGDYRTVSFSYSDGPLENGKHLESGNGSTSFHPPFPVPDFLLSKLVQCAEVSVCLLIDADQVWCKGYPLKGSLFQTDMTWHCAGGIKGLEIYGLWMRPNITDMPPSQKVHQIMVGTAKFVSEHGGQSEIILKVKQGSNPMFGFLNPDHYLHEYFRFLVQNPELVRGTAKKRPSSAEVVSNTGEGLSLLGMVYGTGDEDDDEDKKDAQLENTERGKESLNKGAAVSSAHCSLAEMDVQPLQLPANTAVSEGGSFDVVHSDVGHTVSQSQKDSSLNFTEELDASPAMAINLEELEASPVIVHQRAIEGTESRSEILPAVTNGSVLEPPLPLKRVIQKVVEFIIRNGKDFEAVVRDRDKADGRFLFLLPWNEYHPFYQKVLEAAQEENRKKGRKVVLNLGSEKPSSQDTTIRANHVSQEKRKRSYNVSLSQPSEASNTSKSLSQAEKKMKTLVGKREFIQPNKNIGQFSSAKADHRVGLSVEAAAAVVNAVTHRPPVRSESKALVDAKEHHHKSPSQSSKDQEYGMSADAAAAAVMAATRGFRGAKQDISNNKSSSSGLLQKITLREMSVGGGSEGLNASGDILMSHKDEVGIAKAVAQAAARAVAHEADSADALLAPADKLKAERLKRAKMFAAMIKSRQVVSEGISDSLGLPLSSKAVGSEAVGSASNKLMDTVSSDTRVHDSEGAKLLDESMKGCNGYVESVAEMASSSEAIPLEMSGVKLHSMSREQKEDGLHDHSKKRKSHHTQEDEDKSHYRSKRSHHNDGSEVEQRKNSDSNNHHKSKKSYGDKSNGSEHKDHHRTKGRKSEVKDTDNRTKKSHHDHKEDLDRKSRRSKHKHCDDQLSDSANETLSSQHRDGSVNPSEGKNSSSTRKFVSKEPQESQRILNDRVTQFESSDNKIMDKTLEAKERIPGDDRGSTITAEVPDDIRAKVRAMLLLNT